MKVHSQKEFISKCATKLEAEAGNHVNLGPPPVDVRVPPARGLRAARGPPGHHAAPHPHQVPQPPLPGARHRAHHTYGED